MEEEAREGGIIARCHVRLLSTLYAKRGTGPCNTHLRTWNNGTMSRSTYLTSAWNIQSYQKIHFLPNIVIDQRNTDAPRVIELN